MQFNLSHSEIQGCIDELEGLAVPQDLSKAKAMAAKECEEDQHKAS